jgi:hypothetical protein
MPRTERSVPAGAGPAALRAVKAKVVPSNLEELFAQLRSGAANVAGVDFQVSLSVMLRSAGRAGSVVGLSVVAVSPEGFEDVDCHLADESRLLSRARNAVQVLGISPPWNSRRSWRMLPRPSGSMTRRPACRRAGRAGMVRSGKMVTTCPPTLAWPWSPTASSAARCQPRDGRQPSTLR